MAKSYVVGFEAVELVDGLSEDKAVWLYMRATLYNEGDLSNPLWFGDVGSLPPDANRPAPDGYPVGDAGWYADHLIVGTEVSNSSATNVPNFSVGPVTVDDGQVLEVLIFMLPKVWFETKSVPPDEADRFGFGLLGAGIGAGGFGIAGAVAGAILGAFAPQDHDVTVPCYNTVISARQVFTPADLDSMQSLGRQRFGPQDNEAYEACHQPIDSYYWLSANNAGWSFGTTPDTKKELCLLEPRAYEPAADQLRGAWGDAGDRYNDCLLVSVQCPDAKHGDVVISRGPAGAYATIAQFSRVPIHRLTPDPVFTRNVFDDGCPARSVHPDCPECLRFINLSTEMIVRPQLLHLGMQAGSHVGTRPPFPFVIDTDRVTQLRPVNCGPCEKRSMSARKPAAAREAKANADRVRLDRAQIRDRLEPGRLGPRWNVALTDAGMVKLWPNGSQQTRDLKTIGISDDIAGWFPAPPESGLSWVLPCSDEFRLATYQEIRGDTGCIGRLRYTRRNAQGVIVADVMLSRLPSPVN